MDFPGKSQDQSSAQEVSLCQRLTGASAEAEPGPRVYCGGFIAPGSSSSSCGIDSSTVCTGLEQGAASQKLVSLSTLDTWGTAAAFTSAFLESARGSENHGRAEGSWGPSR